jgi:hypothetical protein
MTTKTAKKILAKKPSKKLKTTSSRSAAALKKSAPAKKPTAKSSKTKVSVCATRPDVVAKHYESLSQKFERYRKELGRGLTLAEKILFSHLDNDSGVNQYVRGKSFIMLRPDRVAMQDATAQLFYSSSNPAKSRLLFRRPFIVIT